LVALAKQVFDSGMQGANQISNLRNDVAVTRTDLLRVHKGTITENGVRTNVSVGIQYIEAWLGGRGSVPINNMMEDAATAEICRAQLWQWINHGSVMVDGRIVSQELCLQIVSEELTKLRAQLGSERYDTGYFGLASRLFEDLLTADEFPVFLTLDGYEELQSIEQAELKPIAS
jgi:malate synthase